MLGFSRAAVERGLPKVPTAPWVACFLAHGDSDGRYCLHSCGNRACCNPSHLRWGTPAENMQDRVIDNRSSFQKLTVEDVRSIREAMKLVRRPHRAAAFRALAIKYQVSEVQVRMIVYRQAWAWLED
jgi:hypothetical protein